MYVKYEVDLNQSIYSEYDKVRKEYVGDKMVKSDMETVLEMCGIPSNSPKLWNLLLSYEIILKEGKAAGTRYMLPKDLPPYARFQSIEKEFYNGCKPKKPKDKPVVKEKEVARTVLNEEFCISYLKERNYIVFKVEPDFDKLSKVLNPEFLLQNSKATLK